MAAAYYAYYSPYLITFAMPAMGLSIKFDITKCNILMWLGNEQYCDFVNRVVNPFGGIRLSNEFDPIPSIAQLVGYKHCGVPIKLRLSDDSKEVFENESINSVSPAFNLISTHMLFEVILFSIKLLSN